MRRPHNFAYLVLTFLFAASRGSGADIRFNPWTPPQISITGEIVQGDAEKLRKAFAQCRDEYAHKPRPTGGTDPMVVLDSPGGSVPVALEMGRILRDSLAWTTVLNNQTCSSSCVFLLAGGVRRTVAVKARVGLHRPRFEYDSFALLSKDEARAAYNKLVQACVDFMREMGISDQVFSDMLESTKPGN